MASISIEALIGILFLVMIVAIFQSSLGTVLEKHAGVIMQECLVHRAASTALLATTYSYAVAHGHFSPHLACSVGDKAVCKDNHGRIASAETYKRRGGGD